MLSLFQKNGSRSYGGGRGIWPLFRSLSPLFTTWKVKNIFKIVPFFHCNFINKAEDEFYNAVHTKGNSTMGIHLFPIGMQPEIDGLVVKPGANLNLCEEYANFVKLISKRLKKILKIVFDN